MLNSVSRISVFLTQLPRLPVSTIVFLRGLETCPFELQQLARLHQPPRMGISDGGLNLAKSVLLTPLSDLQSYSKASGKMTSHELDERGLKCCTSDYAPPKHTEATKERRIVNTTARVQPIKLVIT